MSGGTVASLVSAGAGKLGIVIPNGSEILFERYFELLEKYGQNVNLTAISGEGDVAGLHFLDSIAISKVASFSNKRVIDVGSGAGFPGIPLKLIEPTIDLTVLDASGKRVNFLKTLCRDLEIDVECVQERAEEASKTPELREKFDIAVSRAVARLNILCELCLPYVKTGGLFLAMKGAEADREAEEAENAIEKLGAAIENNYYYEIPGKNINHKAIVIRKVKSTPDEYPRRYAKIKKNPL